MDKKDLIFDLLRQVGLCSDKHSFLVDEDYSTNVMMLGPKMVKYSYNNYVKIDRSKEVFYNPIENVKLMLNTFSFYMGKLSEDDKYFNVYYVDKVDETYSVVLEGDTGKYRTRFYNNLSLAYIEMIYLLNGHDQDLTSLDVI